MLKTRRLWLTGRGEMNERFDRFTERARKVLALAHEEAVRLHHTSIGTEHLLLGLVREHDGVAARLLSHLGVELDQVRREVEALIHQNPPAAHGALSLATEARRAIELAVDEAQRLGHHYIGTEHLLLGLVRQEEGVAAAVLRALGVRLDGLRQIAVRPLAESASSPRLGSSAALSELDLQRFTQRARRALAAAHEEAISFNHNYIGTEHVLLGLAYDADSTAALVLARLGVGLERVRSAVTAIVGRGDHLVSGEVGLTPRARTAIALAVQESRELGHSDVGTEHLLLGLVLEGEGIAAGILESLSLSLVALRGTVVHILAERAPSAPVPVVPPEAAGLLEPGAAALTCTVCAARSPLYFRNCFNCGTKLES